MFSEPLGGVRNLQVTDPTINSLNVRWDPAEGAVREYIIIYVPSAGGEQEVVQKFSPNILHPSSFSEDMNLVSDPPSLSLHSHRSRSQVPPPPFF